jgi:hypothetical protein
MREGYGGKGPRYTSNPGVAPGFNPPELEDPLELEDEDPEEEDDDPDELLDEDDPLDDELLDDELLDDDDEDDELDGAGPDEELELELDESRPIDTGCVTGSQAVSNPPARTAAPLDNNSRNLRRPSSVTLSSDGFGERSFPILTVLDANALPGGEVFKQTCWEVQFDASDYLVGRNQVHAPR